MTASDTIQLRSMYNVLFSQPIVASFNLVDTKRQPHQTEFCSDVLYDYSSGGTYYRPNTLTDTDPKMAVYGCERTVTRTLDYLHVNTFDFFLSWNENPVVHSFFLWRLLKFLDSLLATMCFLCSVVIIFWKLGLLVTLIHCILVKTPVLCLKCLLVNFQISQIDPWEIVSGDGYSTLFWGDYVLQNDDLYFPNEFCFEPQSIPVVLD